MYTEIMIMPPITSALGRLRLASFSSEFMLVAIIQPSYAKAVAQTALSSRELVLASLGRRSLRGKVVHQHVRGADKADYYANNSHEPERYKLYHGGGSLNLAGKLGGDCVHEIRAAHIEHHKRNALRPYHAAAFGRRDYEREIGPAGRDENEGIARAEPAENAGERGVINGAHEPAHIVAVLAAYRGLGIVNYAVHLNVFLRHHGERQYAHQHYNAADYPRQYAQWKVAVGFLQYGLRLKEYARAYNDAYYHADSRK